MEKIIMTQEGIDKLAEEHNYLVTIKRKEVAEQLKEAAAYGKLDENTEYAVARMEQNTLEYRIDNLADKLSRVIASDKLETDKSTVHIGCKVKVIDEYNEEVEYIIVGDGEGDIMANRLSCTCSVGKALMGKKANEIAQVDLPSGDIVEYKIVEVSI